MADTHSKDARGADATSRSPASLADDEPRGPDASASHPNDGQSNQNRSTPSTTRFDQAPTPSTDLVVVIQDIFKSKGDVPFGSRIDPTLLSALDVVWTEQNKEGFCDWSRCKSRLTDLEVEALKSLPLNPAYSEDTAQQFLADVGRRLHKAWKEHSSSSLRGQLSRNVSPD